MDLYSEYTKNAYSPVRRQTQSKKWTKAFSRHFKDNIATVNKNMKICSTSLASGEMQIKTNMRYYFIVRWL